MPYLFNYTCTTHTHIHKHTHAHTHARTHTRRSQRWHLLLYDSLHPLRAELICDVKALIKIESLHLCWSLLKEHNEGRSTPRDKHTHTHTFSITLNEQDRRTDACNDTLSQSSLTYTHLLTFYHAQNIHTTSPTFSHTHTHTHTHTHKLLIGR